MPSYVHRKVVIADLDGQLVGYVPLTNRSYCALVDVQDASAAEGYAWYVNRIGNIEYVATHISTNSKRLLHSLIGERMGLTGLVDHKSRSGIDNRRENLRSSSKGQNAANSRKMLGTTSQYKGVCWDKRKRKWMAKIRTDGRSKFLGYFALNEEEQAARAYDKAALATWGEYARLNFPQEQAA